MNEQDSNGQTDNSQSMKTYSARGVFFCIAKIVVVITGLVGSVVGIITIYNTFWGEPEINYSFSKYAIGKTVLYYGELVNVSSIHADKVSLKGKFSSEIIDLDINTNDIIKGRKVNNPSGSIEFSLERLSKKNKCNFYILVNQQSEITEQVHVSWSKGGDLLLIPKPPDEKIKKGIELGIDLSRKARQKWFEDNAKNIRK